MILTKLSFTISIMGIFILLLLSNLLSPKLIEIQEITPILINKQIQVQGIVQDIKNYDNFQVLTIADNTGKINITLDKLTNIKINQTIIVIGKITEYKTNLQVQADKIISS